MNEMPLIHSSMYKCTFGYIRVHLPLVLFLVSVFECAWSFQLEFYIKMTKINDRVRAIGKLEEGCTQINVAQGLGVNVRTVKRWWRQWKTEKSVNFRKKSGRPKVLKKPAKLVISKSMHKRGWSSRKLSNKLTARGYPCSKDTVHRYLKSELGAVPFKRQVIPKITENQAIKRLQFARARQHWRYEDWSKVIFTDECPVYLMTTGNRQNDRVWTNQREKVLPIEKSKFSPKVMIWGAMTATGLSKLHILPANQHVTAAYYVENILSPFLLEEIHRNGNNGQILEQKFHENTLELIFQQDGAPAHTAAVTQTWLQTNFPSHWGKDVWPPNSPDMSPIENLWGILKEKINFANPQPSNLDQLKNTILKAWSEISPETLENLIRSMPDRIDAVIKAKGYFPMK